MFKPSTSLAQRAIKALQRSGKGKVQPLAVESARGFRFLSEMPPPPEGEVQVHLHPVSGGIPKSETPTPGLASVAIGERLESVLQVLARERGTLEPGKPVVVLSKAAGFSKELMPRVVEIFGGQETAEVIQDVLQSLAKEFRAWVAEHADDRERLGLRLEKDGRLILECPEPPPPVEGLTPLSPLEKNRRPGPPRE